MDLFIDVLFDVKLLGYSDVRETASPLPVKEIACPIVSCIAQYGLAQRPSPRYQSS